MQLFSMQCFEDGTLFEIYQEATRFLTNKYYL